MNTTRITRRHEIASVISTSRREARIVVVPVEDRREIHGLGDGCLELGKEAQNAVDRLDDIRPRLPEHDDGYSRSSVYQSRGPHVFDSESVTPAMSDSRTGAPELYATTRGRYSSALKS